MHVDLNCDMGESFGRYALGDDDALLEIVTSANIACGFHAGDPEVMQRTVARAVENRVAVGAHPGYPDLQGFGRRDLSMTPPALKAGLIYQIGALSAFARAAGTKLSHVKPHGALYNAAARDASIAATVADAVHTLDPDLIVVTQPHTPLVEAARDLGLRVALEGFADRAYQPDGTLRPRSKPGAVLHQPDRIADRAVRMVREGSVEAYTGETIPLRIDTLCVHGDTPGAEAIARAVRDALVNAGIEVRPL
jgi:5-oxoprolinase (ATP-hydrolysing) subunit A